MQLLGEQSARNIATLIPRVFAGPLRVSVRRPTVSTHRIRKLTKENYIFVDIFLRIFIWGENPELIGLMTRVVYMSISGR